MIYEPYEKARRRFLINAPLWVLAMSVALMLDTRVAVWAHSLAVDPDHIGNVIIKMPGEFRFTLAVALALLMWHPTTWRAAGHLALSGLLGGLIYSICKWSAGRVRPEKGIAPFELQPFIDGWVGLFEAKNLTLPSGHTTLAFATAGVLTINIPRLRWLFYAGAAAVGAERVCENAHYLSDVVAGAGIGTLSAYLVHWTERWLAARTRRRQAAGTAVPVDLCSARAV